MQLYCDLGIYRPALYLEHTKNAVWNDGYKHQGTQ